MCAKFYQHNRLGRGADTDRQIYRQTYRQTHKHTKRNKYLGFDCNILTEYKNTEVDLYKSSLNFPACGGSRVATTVLLTRISPVLHRYWRIRGIRTCEGSPDGSGLMDCRL